MARCGSRRTPSSSTPRRRRRPCAGTATDETDGSTPVSGGDRCNPTYTIEEGDAPYVVTAKFDITIEALNAANVSTPDWPNFYTGREIKLPPPADCAGGTAATTTTTPG